jgi:hypothetical protein
MGGGLHNVVTRKGEHLVIVLVFCVDDSGDQKFAEPHVIGIAARVRVFRWTS